MRRRQHGATAWLSAAVCAGALAVGAARPVSAEGLYVKVSNIGLVPLERVVDEFLHARVVMVGEEHGNAAHHRAQLEILKTLQARGARLAVGMEMFREDGQDVLDRWSAGTIDQIHLLRLFQEHWYLDYWPIYRDILFFLREKRIPIVGLNVRPPPLSEAQAAPAGTSCAADPRYREVLAAVLGQGNHHAVPLEEFCSAQMAQDAAMARTLAAYLRREPDRLVVVMAGTFHAWKHGIPRHLREAGSFPTLVVIPSEDRSFLNYDIFLAEADYVLWFGEGGGGAAQP